MTADAAGTSGPDVGSAGTVDVKAFGAVGDGRDDDTAGISRAYARANTLMAAGHSVFLEFPFGHYRVGATPQIIVPDGVDLSVVGARGGSRIDVLTASAAVSISARSTNGSGGHVAIEDLVLDAASTGIGNAIEVQGMPRSRGGGGVAPIIRDITCDNDERRVFAACIVLSDVSDASIAGLRDLGLRAGNGRPDQGVGLWLRTTPDGTANANFSVDDHVEDFEQVGGFAFLRTDGHVEGVQIHHGTVVASSYGTYSTVFPGGKGGVLWLDVSDTHLNTAFAGIYCEHCTSLKVANDLFYSLAAVTPDPDAVLPVHWKAFVGSAPTGWAGVWCPDCKGMTLSGNEFYGFLRSRQASTALYGFGYDFGGGYPGDLWGNTVTGNVIGAMSSGPLVLDGRYGKTVVAGNVFNTTTKTLYQAVDPNAGVMAAGNLQDGEPSDAGTLMGRYRIDGAPVEITHALRVAGRGGCPGAGSQGATICWNLSAGMGETDFLDTRGSGTGGFAWFDVDPGAPTPPPDRLMTLDDAGRLATRGPIAAGGSISAAGAMHLNNVALARLPARCAPGDMQYVTDGRKPSEAAGSGSGAPAICSPAGRGGGVAWFSMFSGTPVAN